MFKKILCSSLIVLFLSYAYSLKNQEIINSNIFKVTILDNNQIQFGYSYSTGWSTGPFWIGIHCQNDDEIAGFQLELPSNLQLLNATGGRSEKVFLSSQQKGYDFRIFYAG